MNSSWIWTGWLMVAAVMAGVILESAGRAQEASATMPAGEIDDIASRMQAQRAMQMNRGGTVIPVAPGSSRGGIAGAAEAPPLAVNEWALKKTAPVYTGADASLIEPNNVLITQIIPLVHMNAVRLRNDLTPLFSADSDVTANSDSNTIVITDRAAQVRRVVEMIQSMDAVAGGRAGEGISVLSGRGASAVARAELRPGMAMGVLTAPVAEMRVPRGGVVETVMVKDGQAVRKGDVILRMAGEGREPGAEMRSPLDGQVTTVDAVAGGSVEGGKLVTKVVETGEMKVDFELGAGDLGKVQVGQRVAVLIGAGAEQREAAAEVTYVSPVMEVATQMAVVRGKVLEARGMRVGEVVRVNVGGR